MSLESIALIPSGYKATKVYSQLPVNGNGDFTYDRGTADQATRVNKNGLIEDVALDVPRLDYLDGGCPSLLLEPATTNLFDYSEDLILWGSPIGLSVSADSTISPDGSLNADLVTEDTSTGAHTIRKLVGPTITATNDYSFSFFVKSNGRDIVALSNDAGSASANAFLNITSGSVLSSTFDSISMEDYGNGWWRIKTTLEATGTGDYNTRIYTAIADGSFSHTGDGTSGFYLWGLQVEQQSYATSYVRSLGSQGVRNAETCNGAGTTAEINSQEGVLFFEGRALQESGSDRAISLTDGGTLNSVSMFNFSTANTLRYLVFNGGVTQASIDFKLVDIKNYHKVALYYKQNDFRLYVNGLLVGIDPSGSFFASGTLNQLELEYGASAYRGRVKKLSYYDDTTTDLEALTGFTSFAEMASYLSYS